jgi:hypothetical protein
MSHPSWINIDNCPHAIHISGTPTNLHIGKLLIKFTDNNGYLIK